MHARKLIAKRMALMSKKKMRMRERKRESFQP